MSAIPANTPTKPYYFVLGAVLSLFAIPLAIIITIVAGQIISGIAAIFSAVGMMLAFILFGFGSRRKHVQGAGFAFALIIGLVATLLAFVAGFISAAYSSFTAVNGKGGIFGSVFMGILENRITTEWGDIAIQLLMALGIATIFLARGLGQTKAAALRNQMPDAAEAAISSPTADYKPDLDTIAPPQATIPSAPAPTTAPPAEHSTTVNEPSSGILLNGKPIGEQQPKKRFWK